MAESQFISNSTVTYDLQTDGSTSVTHDITLQNKTSEFYATSYTLSLNGIVPINPTAYEGTSQLPVKITQKDSTTSIEVNFPNAVVGKDSKREFSVNFSDKTLVNKTGEIWEITTPKLADAKAFDFYSTIIKVPDSFGQLAYISPAPSFKGHEDKEMIFSFDKETSVTNAITAAFGQFQVFSFDLSYHIENPLNQTVITDIAIPPDTNDQKMNYTNITPKPTKIAIDNDGNWIATYQLKAHEKMDIQVQGGVQIFPNRVTYPKIETSNLQNYLKPTGYWQTNDEKIKQLAGQLKTPRAIYDYVSTHLSYDYDKVAPNIQRLGSVEALKNPTQAICTEFTDLFIAIARAANIPAREIEGYAYTENPQVQPLSLVADVLHAWPQYWDYSKNAWISVDPTWGSTSGIDYFNKLDLRHFAFVIHGSDDKRPYPAGSYKLGANPQKDVNVSFGQLPAKRDSNLQISVNTLSQLPFSDQIISARIKNPGPVALYDVDFKVQFDKSVNKSEQIIPVILPYGYYETNIVIPYSFLGQKIPYNVELLTNGTQKTEFKTYKTFVTVSNLLMLALFIFFAIFLVYLKFKDAKTKKHI